MSEPTQVAVRGPVELIALVPHLLGFEPTDGDVVVIGMRAGLIVMTACSPLGALSAHEQQAAADQLAGPVVRNNIDSAAVVGYGGVEQIASVIDTLHGFLTLHDIVVVEAICVSGDRYQTHQPTGGVADGIPFDATTTVIAATMVHAGSITLPNRTALVEQFDAVTGQERADMHAATLRARHRLQHITARADDPDDIVVKAGVRAAATAYDRHNDGGRLTDDEAAWLTVLLTRIAVRDHVFAHTHGHSGHVTLWTDLTRRAQPDLAAAPATLLAFAAWRMGNGAVANIALERALRADPRYRLARLLAGALADGLPPHHIAQHLTLADDPLTG